jgi:hypothetical protein
MKTLNVRFLLPDSSYIKEENLYKFFKPIYSLGVLVEVQEHRIVLDVFTREWSALKDSKDINLEIEETKVLNSAIIHRVTVDTIF